MTNTLTVYDVSFMSTCHNKDISNNVIFQKGLMALHNKKERGKSITVTKWNPLSNSPSSGAVIRRCP